MRTCFILLIAFMLLTGAGQALAQTTSPPLNPEMLKDGYAMHKGRMIRIQAGQVSVLTQDMHLENGIKVYRNGLVSIPGKSRQQLSEGYAIKLDGKIVLLKYDMMRDEAIREHSQKIAGNTDSEVIITDNGIVTASSPEEKITIQQLLSRRVTLIGQRNVLIKQKADLLNKALDKKAQQSSPEIQQVNQKLEAVNQELKELEKQLAGR